MRYKRNGSSAFLHRCFVLRKGVIKMEELNSVVIEFVQILKEIDELYARKRELEKKMTSEYNKVRELCGITGKTINDL